MVIAISIVSMQKQNHIKNPNRKGNGNSLCEHAFYLMTSRPHSINENKLSTKVGKGSHMTKLNKNQMVSNLKIHGVKVASKLKVADVAMLYAQKSKVLNMGNRTGEFYFGTKAGTWAGRAARAVALGAGSTSMLRKVVTAKYSFRQTLGRLEDEGFIRFTDKNRRTFELTTRGYEIAQVYKARFGDVGK